MMVDLTLRFVPGQHWVRVYATTAGTVRAGHTWMYYGCVRRDAWRWGRLGLAVLRLPRRFPGELATPPAGRYSGTAIEQGETEL